MSRQIQIRRGTSAEHANFTGAIGEITMDTTNKTLRVHDGETAGGTILAKKSEIPTVPDISFANIFSNLMPNYAAAVTMAANTTHTATSNGWILFYQFSNNDRYFTIDGTNYHFGAGNGNEHYSGNSIMIPISSGQTFKGKQDVIFFPCICA